MITTVLKFFLCTAIVLYFIIILAFLKRKALSLKYTLLWLLSGVIMAIMIIFPQVLDFLVHVVDIKTPVNGIFAISIFFILIILMSLTSIVSKQSDKIKNLTQNIAFLEKRIRDLENK